eukprot:CAMPEP_0171984058 /NCGR_PEP_ID=MMETSP0993-20121228/273630_1 /TAXON_ID=483369 /ORGANISM="non described non described, Strain CCMP2098" /LENGTH=792 /DNA_ID=CAMNT_0012636861 /DNA_START=558 /DNA_END=2935 /DNA_ORIENTATION=-
MAGKIPFWATDRKNILSVLSKDGHKLRELPEEFYNDVEIVTAAVTDVGSVLQQATDGIKMNCEVVAAAFKSDERSFEYASESLKNSQTFVTSLIALENQTRSFGACALQNASPGIQADPAVVLASVTQRGTSLAYAATELKNDPTIASAAIKQNAKAFEFVSASLRSDPDIIRAVLESMGLTFDFSSIISSGKSPMGDRDLMLMLAPLGSHALKFASVEIKKDREVVLAAVRADWCDTKGDFSPYAATELKNDPTIASAAIKQNARAFSFVSASLRSDPEIIRALLDGMGLIFDLSSIISSGKSPMGDRDLMLMLAPLGSHALKFASVEIKKDREVVLAAVRADCHAIRFASREMRNDPEIVLAATAGDCNGSMSSWASDELLANRDFALQVVSQSDRDRSGLHLEHFSQAVRSDPQVAMAAVQNGAYVSQCSLINTYRTAEGRELYLLLCKTAVIRDGDMLREDHTYTLRKNKDVVMLAVTKGVRLCGHQSAFTRGTRALSCASQELRADPEIVLAAVELNQWHDELWASDELLSNRDFALQVVSQSDRNRSGLHLENFSQAVCSDPQVAVAAVQNGGYVSHCSIGPWRTAEERELYWFLFKTAVSRNGDMLSQGFIVTRENKDVVMLAVTKGVRLCGHHSADTRGTRALSYASQELQADPEIVLAAVELNGEALEYASATLRADFDVVVTAVSQNADALVWASQDMKSGLCTQIKEKLYPHRCFVVVLLGMTSFALVSEENLEGSDELEPKTKSAVFRAETAAPLTGRCFLQMLGNFDPETGTSIKKQIA